MLWWAAVTDGPGYTGHVSDSATGLSYMQQRYMDPQLGVFLSVDPVTAYEQPVGQFNRYRYANGNPYKFTDPDGRNALLAAPLVVVPIVVGVTYYATTTAEQRTNIGNKLDGAVKACFRSLRNHRDCLHCKVTGQLPEISSLRKANRARREEGNWHDLCRFQGECDSDTAGWQN